MAAASRRSPLPPASSSPDTGQPLRLPPPASRPPKPKTEPDPGRPAPPRPAPRFAKQLPWRRPRRPGPPAAPVCTPQDVLAGTANPQLIEAADVIRCSVHVRLPGHDAPPDPPSLRDAVRLPLHRADPVRRVVAYRGRRSVVSMHYTHTNCELLLCESMAEVAVLTSLDQAATVVGLATQPFLLTLQPAAGGRAVRHVPDLLALLDDGSYLLVDVTGPLGLRSGRARWAWALTAAACRTVPGIRYCVATGLPAAYNTNLRWMSGCARPGWAPPAAIGRLVASGGGPWTIADLLDEFTAVGRLWEPIALTAVGRLLWQGRLTADLTRPLRDDTVVEAVT